MNGKKMLMRDKIKMVEVLAFLILLPVTILLHILESGYIQYALDTVVWLFVITVATIVFLPSRPDRYNT